MDLQQIINREMEPHGQGRGPFLMTLLRPKAFALGHASLKLHLVRRSFKAKTDFAGFIRLLGRGAESIGVTYPFAFLHPAMAGWSRRRMNSQCQIFLVLSLAFLILNSSAVAKEEIPIPSLFTRYADSVVMIVVLDKKNRATQAGSGFIIREDGLIATNSHILKRAQQAFVKLRDQKVYTQVEVLILDHKKDIALIKIPEHGLTPIVLGNSHHVQIGQRVFTIGNPLGLESTVSDGLISSIRDGERGIKLFQISVPLSKGSSGGPLFNLEGEAIGVTMATLKTGQNLNFALPINEVRNLLSKIDSPKYSKQKDHKMKDSLGIVTTTKLKENKNYQIYVIQPHDTLYHLSKRFRVSVEEIMHLNQLKGPQIFVGQQIKLPKD